MARRERTGVARSTTDEIAKNRAGSETTREDPPEPARVEPKPQFGYEPDGSAPAREAENTWAKPAPAVSAARVPGGAYALMDLDVSEPGPPGDDGKPTFVRRTIAKDQPVGDEHLAGLVEGKHFTRTPAGERAKPVTFHGRDAKTAKIAISGHAVDANGNPVLDSDGRLTRHEFQPGDVVPIDQLGGLVEGKHFE